MKTIKILFFVLGITFNSFSQTYITKVTIVDVENEKLIPNQTVVISDGLIKEIKKSGAIEIPDNVEVIDGSGKYLIPGLVDAHVHFFQSGGLYTRPDVIDLRKFKSYEKELTEVNAEMEEKLRRYVQNGITTVIDVGSTYNFLEKRQNFKDKDFAPDIFMTGPLLTTYEPEVYKGLGKNEPFILTKSIEDGIDGVKKQLKYNPDFIKIWYIAGADGLSVQESAKKNLPIVKAIIDESHKNGLKVAVHATQRITAQLAVENSVDFLVHSVDDEILDKGFIALMKKNEVILNPTLTVSHGYKNTFAQSHNFSNYELETANPFQLGSLFDLKHLPDSSRIKMMKDYATSRQFTKAAKTSDSISRVNLKLLSDAGVLIATGTDAGNIGTLHASFYLDEVLAMKESGMSNWQVLKASTLNGAKILDKEIDFGSIKKGKFANMVLLDQNPIENLQNLIKINTVINKGQVIKPSELLEITPEVLAQQQLNTYNQRNIEAFLEPYAEDVKIYTFPNQLMYEGKEMMRQGYTSMFNNTPNLHCELVHRIIKGNVVIDEERVQFGDKIIKAVAIYLIKDNKISEVYFVRE
jgi:imidazolonepropionase-like amidohydrolase